MSTTPARSGWRYLVLPVRLWVGLVLIELAIALVLAKAEHHMSAQRARDQRFERDGVPSNAVLDSKHRQRSGRKPFFTTSWVIWYSYQDADGWSYRWMSYISRESWEQLNEGDQLPIVYMRSDPGWSRPVDEERGSPWELPAFAVILLVVLVVIGISQIIRAVQEAGRAKLDLTD